MTAAKKKNWERPAELKRIEDENPPSIIWHPPYLFAKSIKKPKKKMTIVTKNIFS